MKKSVFISCAAALMLAAPALAGESADFTPVKDKALIAALTDAMMISEYRARGDDMTKFTERHNKNGTTDYKLENKPEEKGTWDIIGGDKVCYRYPDSEVHPGPYCYVLYLRDGCYYSYSTSKMTYHGPRDWDNWSYRAVEKGSGKSCAAPVS